MNRWLAHCLLLVAVTACSAGGSDADPVRPGAGGSSAAGAGGTATGGTGGAVVIDAGPDTGAPASNCAESSKVSYLVSREYDFYSFNPEKPGLEAYALVGHLSCPSSSSPQAMAIDRSGMAYVFFDSGELFLVDTVTVACSATTYKHPASGSSFTLGMGFTADSDGAQTEKLFAASPDVGLYTIDPTTWATSLLGVHDGVAADLTGGPDGRLFLWRAMNKTLYELDRSNNYEMSVLHAFTLISYEIQAWALTRFAGVFHMFSAPSSGNSMTTMFDPASSEETVRDQNVGFRVVGAGQSTCVPPPPVK
jgi:hypothetical protein